jgi:mRNA-degrading endonuclease RelE of RelBE toxin-antitoxin system
VAEILEDIKDNPFIGKPQSRKLTREFSYREGVYRMLYLINQKDKLITILTADHRGTVYN